MVIQCLKVSAERKQQITLYWIVESLNYAIVLIGQCRIMYI